LSCPGLKMPGLEERAMAGCNCNTFTCPDAGYPSQPKPSCGCGGGNGGNGGNGGSYPAPTAPTYPTPMVQGGGLLGQLLGEVQGMAVAYAEGAPVNNDPRRAGCGKWSQTIPGSTAVDPFNEYKTCCISGSRGGRVGGVCAFISRPTPSPG
jgi:hypothetical protein